ncbi:MAG: hypothetical protein JWP12_3562 [Bacteroidetes bacterium]|nr:hypothetical protein [Bacteroidota bacterium]
MFINALYAGLIFSAAIFNGCDPKKNEDPKKVAEQHNDAKFNTSNQESDAHFLTDAAAMCLQQIKLAKLAQQNSIRPDVQERGKIFETEYTKIYKSITYLATIKTVTLPSDLSDEQKKIYTDLGFEISKDFDKKYFDRVIIDHNAAIEEYQKVQKETSDGEIKSFIEKTLPVLTGNLNLIKTYQQQ